MQAAEEMSQYIIHGESSQVSVKPKNVDVARYVIRGLATMIQFVSKRRKFGKID